jgi:hypothetical protein
MAPVGGHRTAWRRFPSGAYPDSGPPLASSGMLVIIVPPFWNEIIPIHLPGSALRRIR